ncbi:TPA: site-specific DNA-methyltransferase [Legionella pneumophila]|nr:site-specific DNA-methyltransferase [Legionella pneumophila]
MKKVEFEDGQSVDIISENIEKMKELFPEAFSEAGVNFDTLRQLLGDVSVLEEGDEKFGLNWHGKKKARQIALTPSTGTLLPCPDKSVDWDTTQNLFIEGDNLEVLKLLQKSYANKVKMIYIDPPYNTGKEFIYPDRFQENLDTYLKYTGQVDGEGMKFSSNTETTGRKHTNWLNMMYPRLKLARQLLRADGVIFISIDDNEVANLREICNEIYGEENLLSNLIWQKKYSPQNDAKFFSDSHEHILCFAKNISEFEIGILPRTDDANARYKNPDNDPRGPWKSSDLTRQEYRKRDYYPIVNPVNGKEFYPPAGNSWGRPRDKVNELINDGRISFGSEGNSIPSLKRFLSEVKQGITPQTIWERKDVGDTQEGKKIVKNLFGNAGIFETAKPPRLIQRAMLVANVSDGDIVLDFFAGSCTTYEAVLEFEKQIRTILVQLPEICDEKTEAYKAGFKTVADIGRARMVKYLEKNRDRLLGRDSGFRVFALNSSSIQLWNPDRTDLEASLFSHEEHLIEGRTEQDILYELLIKRGVDLAVPIEIRKVAGKNIYSIGYGVLFACLDESITKDQVEDIAQGIIAWHGELAPSSDTHVFFRDSAFGDDISKTNMAAILEQNGITHVRSL